MPQCLEMQLDPGGISSLSWHLISIRKLATKAELKIPGGPWPVFQVWVYQPAMQQGVISVSSSEVWCVFVVSTENKRANTSGIHLH